MSAPETLSVLAARIRAGDASAGSEIIAAVMPLMWGACHEVGAALGEDPRNLLSAAVLAGEKSIPYLKKCSVGSWMYYLKKIARAAAIREARNNAPGRSLGGQSTRIGCQSLDAEILNEEGDGNTLHEKIPSQTPGPCNYEHVHRSLARLRPKQRAAVELHFGFDGQGQRTQEESAAALGTTRQNVSLHIAAALRKLRSLLAEEVAMLSGLRAIACAYLLLLLATAPAAHALTYAEWIAGYTSLTGNATLATADPDGDGIKNLMEFALAGGDPTVPSDPGILPKLFCQTRNPDGSYNDLVLKPTTDEVDAAASLHGVLRYQPREGVTGIRFIPMTNQKNLNDWGWGPSAFYEWTDAGYSYARGLSDMKVWQWRIFLRLRVEVIP